MDHIWDDGRVYAQIDRWEPKSRVENLNMKIKNEPKLGVYTYYFFVVSCTVDCSDRQTSTVEVNRVS